MRGAPPMKQRQQTKHKMAWIKPKGKFLPTKSSVVFKLKSSKTTTKTQNLIPKLPRRSELKILQERRWKNAWRRPEQDLDRTLSAQMENWAEVRQESTEFGQRSDRNRAEIGQRFARQWGWSFQRQGFQRHLRKVGKQSYLLQLIDLLLYLQVSIDFAS